MNHPAYEMKTTAEVPIDLSPIDASLDVPKRQKIHAVAVNATEMAEANAQIREHLVAKLTALQDERDGLSEAGRVAEENGWKSDQITRSEMRLAKEIEYYGKLLLAVDAGYTIVPNMPCDQFAIRVKRKGPAVGAQSATSDWHTNPRPSIDDERCEVLPAGHGRYESPRQLVEEYKTQEKLPDGKTRTTAITTPTGFDMIEFPFAAAVPVVMTATQAAMSLKLFDRIGLVPQQVRRTEDPIVLGQIILRQSGRERVASFLIAWHLDLRTL